MGHVVAVLVLAVACGAWVVLQRMSGCENAGTCGCSGTCRRARDGDTSESGSIQGPRSNEASANGRRSTSPRTGS